MPSLSASGGSASSTACEPFVPGVAPTWFVNMGDKTWAAPVTNWLGAVKDPLATGSNSGATGHHSIIDAWTGMGADQTRNTLFMLHNGGHNDYYGNEAYSCDLRDNTPVWRRRRDSSPASLSGNIAKFADGRPCSDHTTQAHVEGAGRWFTAGMASTNYVGFANYRQWWEYSLTTEDYIDRQSATYGGGALSTAALAVYDPADRQIISIHTGNATPAVQFVNVDTMAVALSLNSPTFNSGGTLTASVDTERHLLLVRVENKGFVYNLDNKSAAPAQISITGTPPDVRAALHYHASSRSYFTWDGTTSVFRLTPTISGSTYTALAWSTVAAAGSSATLPPRNPNGMYNKVQLIKNMGNGQAALVIVPAYANPDVFVFKLPNIGV